MKTIHLLVSCLLVAANWAVGEEAPNLDDHKVLEKILGEALSVENGERRGAGRDALFHVKNSQTPYTGWVKAVRENGNVFRLEHYKNGKPDGLHILWGLNGHKSEETHFKDGEPVRVVDYHFCGAKQKELTYKNWKKNGPACYWYDNGWKEFEGHYKDDERHGVWIGYEGDQKNVEGHYNDGKKDGIWIFWDEDGKVVNKIRYKDGEVVKE